MGDVVINDGQSNGKKSLYQRYKESSYEELYMKVFLPIFCEFAATLLHTFWGSLIGPPNRPDVYESINRTILPGEYAANYVVSTLTPALQAGFAVWMIIVVFIKITIIQFNPIMSMSFVIAGILSPYMLVPYVLAQLFGSGFGAFLAQSIKGDEPGPFRVAPGSSVGPIIGAETFNTGVMVFFALAMTLDKRYDQATGPMAIGFTVFQAILTGRWVGSFCLNPARAFGPALVMGEWDDHWVWWVGPACGSLLFTFIYMMFAAPREKVWSLQILKRFYRKRRNENGSSKATDATIENKYATTDT